MVQSVITRMLIFYFIMQGMQYFKGKPNQPVVSQPGVQDPSGAAGVATPTGVPGNIFPKGTRFDIYVYISEMDKFDDFENERALFWFISDVEYGNWNIGPNGDGNFLFENQIELTPVSCRFILFFQFIEIKSTLNSIDDAKQWNDLHSCVCDRDRAVAKSTRQRNLLEETNIFKF